MGEGRILILDRHEAVRDLIGKVVEPYGFEVVAAATGEEALQKLETGRFAAFLLEIAPQGMEGLDLLKVSQARWPDLAVVCLCSPECASTHADLVASGASDSIRKPLDADELGGKFTRILRDRKRISGFSERIETLERAEAERRQVEELKSNFILGVSNEIRSPLTVVKETFSLLLDGHVGTLSEDQREYLGIANKNILRLTNLINTLFDFSRLESGKELQFRFEPTPLISAVEEAWMSLSQSLEEKKIPFNNHLDSESPLVLADRRRLVEVLTHLIGNGIKFDRSQGKISVDVRGLSENRDYLRLVVTDTGYEISPEDLPRVFDRYFQGQKIQEGSKLVYGLGLAITKEIIEGHGGSIQAESRPGAGTSFVFTIPVFRVSTIFSLILGPMLEKAETDKVPLSMIQVEFWDQRTKREAQLSDGVLEGVVYAVKMMVRSYDQVVPFMKNRVYVFALVDKKLAKEIGERIQSKLMQGGYIPKGTQIQFKTYSYPKEARTQDEFLKGCRTFLKED